ncbi:hypothetical protein V6N13_098710 [Hibiscus sabdariffa]
MSRQRQHVLHRRKSRQILQNSAERLLCYWLIPKSKKLLNCSYLNCLEKYAPSFGLHLGFLVQICRDRFTNVASADVIVLPWQILNVIILEMLQYSSQSGLDLLLLPVA